MSPESSTVSENLNEIVRRLKDRQAAFSNAARRTDDPEIKRHLTEFAVERRQFAGQLEDEISRLGKDPETSGTLLGSVRRGLANLQSEVVGEETSPEYEECHYLEYLAEKDYESVLENDLPPGLPSLLDTQLRRTRVALHFLRELKNDQVP